MKQKFFIGDNVSDKYGVSFIINYVGYNSEKGIFYSGAGLGLYAEEELALYVEPRPKIKLYKYAYRLSYNRQWEESGYFYSGDEEFLRKMGNLKEFIKLENHFIEVEDLEVLNVTKI